ncbi:hypothetical protein PoB_006573500 [Plakobranchus ocellatus]|uniref:Uncharacterized protein n=1 Tax=Plakobranchus ocellatus TaxID=259542 RepID=A0AAV4D567_9GAST|nr:hypothetical protein PoB_006573500 [Plakobranchus ocellatus]
MSTLASSPLSESALRSAGTLLSRVRAPLSAPWPDGGPESLRSHRCGLAIYKKLKLASFCYQVGNDKRNLLIRTRGENCDKSSSGPAAPGQGPPSSMGFFLPPYAAPYPNGSSVVSRSAVV